MSARAGRGGRLGPGAVLGAAAGAAVVGAGWLLQHRAVRRSAARIEDPGTTGLALPEGVVHHTLETDDGARIRAVELGSGPPVVLLHGVTLSADIWAHQLRDLSAGHRVIAFDQRGHGASVPGSDGFGDPGRREGRASWREALGEASASMGAPGIRRLALDLWRVLELLEVEDALVVGHSMGGMVSLQCALDTPRDQLRRRVRALALVSTFAGPILSTMGFQRVAGASGPLWSRAVRVAELLGMATLPPGDLSWWTTRVSFGADPSPTDVAFIRDIILATPPATLAGLLPSVGTFDVSARLGEIDVPALVVVGTHDRVTPPRHSEVLTRGLREARMVELARCGHMPMLERPVELTRLVGELDDRLPVRRSAS